jgi:predicted ribosome quality control (RQC) complex YloA/Tae2 family protein
MSFDGLFTKAMSEELGDILKGGRINKIHQP